MHPTPPGPRPQWQQLVEKIRSAPAEEANIAVLDAALLLIAAGAGMAAHGLLLQLLDGELRISPASACRQRLTTLLPALSHDLGLPCPALPDHAELTRKGLHAYMAELEQEDWNRQLQDRYATPLPINPAWTSVPASVVQDWLERGKGKLGQVRADGLAWQQLADFLRDTWRIIQHLCRCGQLAETALLFQLYDSVCSALRHPRNDPVTQAMTSLHLSILLRQEQTEAAQALLRADARKSTAWVESVFSHPGGARLLLGGALRDDMPLDADAIAALQAALEARRQAPPPAASAPEDWHEFLAGWNDDFFARRRRDLSYLQDYYPEQMAWHKLGNPGATEDELGALEQRLGRPLPPGYRRFLQASNGWLVADGPDLLLPAAEVGWFAGHEPEWVASWQAAYAGNEPDDEHYFQRGAHQDSAAIRARYLQNALQISSSNDGYVFLLIPDVRTTDGEWEAWDFGVKLPGARRFPHFFALMQAVRARSTK